MNVIYIRYGQSVTAYSFQFSIQIKTAWRFFLLQKYSRKISNFFIDNLKTVMRVWMLGGGWSGGACHSYRPLGEASWPACWLFLSLRIKKKAKRFRRLIALSDRKSNQRQGRQGSMSVASAELSQSSLFLQPLVWSSHFSHVKKTFKFVCKTCWFDKMLIQIQFC